MGISPSVSCTWTGVGFHVGDGRLNSLKAGEKEGYTEGTILGVKV